MASIAATVHVILPFCRSQRNEEGPSRDPRMADQIWTHFCPISATLTIWVRPIAVLDLLISPS